jgi:hypothetical protein
MFIACLLTGNSLMLKSVRILLCVYKNCCNVFIPYLKIPFSFKSKKGSNCSTIVASILGLGCNGLHLFGEYPMVVG